MGKCASKNVVNGQIVPDAELDAGSPMFAPEAPVTAGESATGAAGAEVTFQGFSPAPVETVAAAAPLPRGQDVDAYPPAGAPQYGYGQHKSYGYQEDSREVITYNTLEEAEEAARKQNASWGVDHVPYDPKMHAAHYGQSYASAFPPSTSVAYHHNTAPTDPRPAELASQQPPAAAVATAQEAAPASPEQQPARPAGGHSSHGFGGYEPKYHGHPEPRSSGHVQQAAAYDVDAAAEQHARASGAFPTAAEAQASPIQTIPESAPLAPESPAVAPVEEPAAAEAQTPEKKQKKKKKKKSNWAW